MSNVSAIGDPVPGYHQHTQGDTNYDFTGSWNSWTANVKCAICSATVNQTDIAAHTAWHEELQTTIKENLKELAMGLAVEVLKELANE